MSFPERREKHVSSIQDTGKLSSPSPCFCDYKKGKTVVQLRPSDIKIDPDFYGNRKLEEREKALYSKFSQNEDLKAILIATRNAVLKQHVPKSNAQTDNILMRVRKQIQIENNVV